VSTNLKTDKEFRDRLAAQARGLGKLVAIDAPYLIIASAVTHLFFTTVSYIGKDVMEEFGKRLIADARQRRGVCQCCETEIAASQTFHPVCEQCDAKQQAEVDRFEKEVGELPDEPA
jgi:hypothetical protein